mmetsp:Transcript_130040/g.324126  ORF Transcript_130040/g.324126 Transcript_130040/m.324126 type:complete len:297 (+) Transcript_130040:249-1139(+)
MQCALPVTGSSSTPNFGAKKRLKKSKRCAAWQPSPPSPMRTRGLFGAGGNSCTKSACRLAPTPAHVTTIPRSMGRNPEMADEFGLRLANADGETSTSKSGVVSGPRPMYSTSISSMPSAAAISVRLLFDDCPSLNGTGGCAGKSILIHGPSALQRNTPAFLVWKDTGTPWATRPVSHSTCAEASVAWPQRETSEAGVNHLMSHAASSLPPTLFPGRSSRKAVSETLFSAATACIQSSSPPRCVNKIAAGLPASAMGVNASTCSISGWRFATRSNRMSNHWSAPCTIAEGPRSSKPH